MTTGEYLRNTIGTLTIQLAEALAISDGLREEVEKLTKEKEERQTAKKELADTPS